MTDKQWIETELNCNQNDSEQNVEIEENEQENKKLTAYSVNSFFILLIIIGLSILLIFGLNKYMINSSNIHNDIIIGNTKGPN